MWISRQIINNVEPILNTFWIAVFDEVADGAIVAHFIQHRLRSILIFLIFWTGNSSPV